MKTTYHRKAPIYWKPLICEVIGAVIVIASLVAVTLAAFSL